MIEGSSGERKGNSGKLADLNAYTRTEPDTSETTADDSERDEPMHETRTHVPSDRASTDGYDIPTEVHVLQAQPDLNVPVRWLTPGISPGRCESGLPSFSCKDCSATRCYINERRNGDDHLTWLSGSALAPRACLPLAGRPTVSTSMPSAGCPPRAGRDIPADLRAFARPRVEGAPFEGPAEPLMLRLDGADVLLDMLLKASLKADIAEDSVAILTTWRIERYGRRCIIVRFDVSCIAVDSVCIV